MLNRTRLSMCYVLSYLTVSGIGFVFFPELSLRLLQSNGTYEKTFVEMSGIFLIGLSIFIFQMIRLKIESLYATTVLIRVLFCLAYGVFYFQKRDPFFLVVLTIVGFGLVLTGVGYRLDRGRLIQKK